MRRVLTCVAAVVAGAVTATGQAEPPPNAPYEIAAADGTPPAVWVETRRGDRWLALGTYCWVECVDYVHPVLRPSLPKLRVTRGEVVRFHAAFRPGGRRWPSAW